MRSTSVLLPAPLAPTSAITSPFRAVKLMSRSTGSSSYAKETPSNASALRRPVTSRAPWSSCCSVGRSSTSRSEEHTSELQSLRHLVCRLLLEKKKKNRIHEQNKRKAET